MVAAIREENSAIKFMVPGKDILPNIRTNVKEENRGVQVTNPLKYLMIRVWNLLYMAKELWAYQAMSNHHYHRSDIPFQGMGKKAHSH